MYYQTPNVEKYVTKVIKYRISILLFFVLAYSAIILAYQPKFIASDDMYWLNESQQSQKTEIKAQDTFIVSKLQIHVDELNISTQKKLQNLHEKLEYHEEIGRVLSLFSHKVVQKDNRDDVSSMLGVISIGSLDNYEMKSFINELSNPNGKFVEDDFHTFNFFLFSTEIVELSKFDIPLKYRVKQLMKIQF